jgi:hypothetical protein
MLMRLTQGLQPRVAAYGLDQALRRSAASSSVISASVNTRERV